MNQEQLQAIRERVNKATLGPWHYNEQFDGIFSEFSQILEIFDKDDAVFIAHAREDVPALLDYADSLKKDAENIASAFSKVNRENQHLKQEIERLRGALEFYANPYNNWSSEYDEPSYSIVDKDNGEIARQALAGETT